MVKDVDDFNLWTLESVSITSQYPEVTDEGVKFRADNDWAVNWGIDSWPQGVGSLGGPNIPTVEGTYGITFNSSTGAYLFGDVLPSTQDIINPSQIKVFPNPASDILNVNLKALELTGAVQIRIIDITGNVVMLMTKDARDLSDLNISSLSSGQYMINISNSDYLIGKRFSIIK